MSSNALLQVLRTIENLSVHGDCTAATLERMGGFSPATLKRCISEARSMGADIVSVRKGSLWVYTLCNSDVVINRVNQWIELEEKRDLTARFR